MFVTTPWNSDGMFAVFARIFVAKAAIWSNESIADWTVMLMRISHLSPTYGFSSLMKRFYWNVQHFLPGTTYFHRLGNISPSTIHCLGSP